MNATCAHPDGKWHCVDCDVCLHRLSEASEYYMVHDWIWDEAGMEMFGGHLCIGCLEDRLGRQLTQVDFIACPVNRDDRLVRRRSGRLQNRLLGRFQLA
jgi:hypothetical protein